MGQDVKKVSQVAELCATITIGPLQRYYDEHERLKAQQELLEKEDISSEVGNSSESMDVGGEKFTSLKSLIATAATVPLATTPVIAVENPVAIVTETGSNSTVAMENLTTPTDVETKKNISFIGQVAIQSTLISKQSTPVIDSCTDRVRLKEWS